MVEPSIERWMGGIDQTLKDMVDRAAERHRVNEMSAAQIKSALDSQNEKLNQELRTIKHDYRNLEQRMENREYIGKGERAELDRKLSEVVADLEEIKEPVRKLMEMRTRWTGIFMVLSALLMAAGFIFKSASEWFLALFAKH